MKKARTSPRRFGPVAGLGAGASVGVVVGLADAVWGATRFARHEWGESLPTVFFLHTPALDLLLMLVCGLLFGVACAVVPRDLGPVALWRRLWRFAGLRGGAGVQSTARSWATSVALLAAAGAVFWVSHLLTTTLRNRVMTALAIVLSLVPVLGAAWLLRLTVAHYLERLGEAQTTRSRLATLALGPIPWLATHGLGAVAVIAVAVWWAVPLQSALPWRPALAAGLGAGGVWLTTDLLLRWRGRAPVWLSIGLTLCAVAWMLSSYLTFDNSPTSQRVADTIERRAPLAARVLRPLARRHDRDGDGYPGWLGGGDCNDERAMVHPAAAEIPDNGVDDNCAGGDLRRAELPPVLRLPRVRPAPPAVKRRRYNVVVVVVDALRADRVGWAGYRRRLTPALDRLARRSVVFERAYTPSPRTSLALPALLTGLYPSELRRAGGYFMRVRRGNPSVAAEFRRAGYVTLASVCHPYLKGRSGLRRGFDHWRVYAERSKSDMNRVTTTDRVVDNALTLLAAHRQGKLPSEASQSSRAPFYLFMYTMDPHVHYLRHPKLANYGRRLVDRYDAEIRFTDHHLSRLIEDLKKHDQLKDTIIVVTADHGEAFGENGTSFHGLWLYEHQVHVPWLLHVPKLGARRVKSRVSLMDLAPTLFDLTGVKPKVRMQGISLLPWLHPKAAPVPQRVVYSELLKSIDNHVKRTLLLGRWKLVHQPHGNRYRLYDLKSDPGEQRNLIRHRPAKAREMKRLYEAFVATQLKLRRGGS